MQTIRPILCGLSFLLLFTSCTQYSTVSRVPIAATATTPEQRALIKSSGRAGKSPQALIGHYLDAANAARASITANPGNSSGAQANYNFAIARILEIISDENLQPWNTPVVAGSGTVEDWSLRLTQMDSRPEYNLSNYDFYPADRYQFKGTLVGERAPKAGLGAPVIFKSKETNTSTYDQFAQGKQVFYGLTAVLQFTGNHCEMVFKDPLSQEVVMLDGQTFPLAADFQAPLALGVSDLKSRKKELAGMFNPSGSTDGSRLIRLQPYDPNKIPVIFVHGLSNSPSTWVPMIDFLREDPQIRKNYQLWVFRYASGLPYPLPTAQLRTKLDEIGKMYPNHKDIVLVGHSMGGMISRLLVTDSGDTLWNASFDRPPGEMGFSQETRRAMEKLLIFKARSDVSRVIYASASHRGSADATNWLGRLGAKLVGNPVAEPEITKEAMDAVTPDPNRKKKLKRLPNSIDVLNPDGRFLKTVDTLPLKPGIPFHSIIGDRGKGGNLSRIEPVSTDGIVPYWSSHLDGAESELIIPSGHWTIHHPAGIAEVKRILKLHLR